MIAVPWEALVSATAAGFTATVFAHSVLYKIMDQSSFEGSVAGYQLIPHAMVGPVCRGIILMEIVLTLALLFPRMRVFGASSAIFMLLGYAAAMFVNIIRGNDKIDCGCGGAHQSLTGSLVSRNIVLAAFVVPILLLDSIPLSLAEAMVVGFSVFALWLGFLLVDRLVANAAYVGLRRH